MKQCYFIALFSLCLNVEAQSSCEEAHSDGIYGYSHVKSAYDSNNISHLKDYAKRSFDAFERAKKILKDCGCDASYNKAYDAAELLYKVEPSATFEDGRFYVKRARDIAKDVINELEICTKLSEEDQDIVALEHERLKLQQQQIELKLKEEKLKNQLAQKEAKELLLKKEQLIQKNEIALDANISTFNDALDACNCEIKVEKVTYEKNKLLNKDLNQIKKEYLSIFKKMTNNYLEKLNACTD
jgi:hypothetical protein